MTSKSRYSWESSSPSRDAGRASANPFSYQRPATPQVIITCPSCATRFVLASSQLDSVDSPRFHCSRCDSIFGVPDESHDAPDSPTNPEGIGFQPAREVANVREAPTATGGFDSRLNGFDAFPERRNAHSDESDDDDGAEIAPELDDLFSSPLPASESLPMREPLIPDVGDPFEPMRDPFSVPFSEPVSRATVPSATDRREPGSFSSAVRNDQFEMPDLDDLPELARTDRPEVSHLLQPKQLSIPIPQQRPMDPEEAPRIEPPRFDPPRADFSSSKPPSYEAPRYSGIEDDLDDLVTPSPSSPPYSAPYSTPAPPPRPEPEQFEPPQFESEPFDSDLDPDPDSEPSYAPRPVPPTESRSEKPSADRLRNNLTGESGRGPSRPSDRTKPGALSPGRERSVQWSGVVLLVSPLALTALLSMLFGAYLVSLGPQAPATLRTIFPSALFSASPELPPPGLVLAHSGFREFATEGGGIVPAVTATLINDTDEGFSEVKIQVALFDAQGRTLSQLVIPLGSTIPPKKMATLSEEELAEIVSTPSHHRIAPRDRVEIAIPFIEPLEAEAATFFVRVHSVLRK